MSSEGATLRGVVAIGASAGSIDVLRRVVHDLPADLPVAVCVVLHVPATSRSVLADIIARRSELSVAVAMDGDALRPGYVYVAPPDHHLLVDGPYVVLDRGPKENSVRPAIDPLFRSVAEGYGARGAAVVVSGALADGSAGALAVAAAGGRVFVQDPAEAAVPSMPEAALRAVPGADVAPAAALAGAIVAAVEAMPTEEASMVPDDLRPLARSRTRPEGPPAALTCPECHGPLWETGDGRAAQYRCRVGHVYTEEVLVEEKGTEVEAAMWSAIEALEEQAELNRRVAVRIADAGREVNAAALRRRAEKAEERAEVLRRVLVVGTREAEWGVT